MQTVYARGGGGGGGGSQQRGRRCGRWADVVFRDTESAALLIADWSRPCVVTVFSIHKAARVYRITLLIFAAEVFYLHF